MVTLCLEKNVLQWNARQDCQNHYLLKDLGKINSARESVQFVRNTVDSKMSNLQLSTSKLCGGLGIKNHQYCATCFSVSNRLPQRRSHWQSHAVTQ